MINKVILIGNVGKDPEIKTFENGNKVANFSLATSEQWKNKDGEKQTSTEWHNIAVFGKLADLVEKYVKKGHSLYVQGKIKTRSWDVDGGKKYMTEIVLNGFESELKFLGSKESSNTTENEQKEDDFPF